MIRPFRARSIIPVAAGALLAAALAACSAVGPVRRAGTATAPPSDGTPASPAGGAAAGGSARVELVQKHGQDGPVRMLTVLPDGRWECSNCAGDDVRSSGQLDPERTQRLRALLTDERLAAETDKARGYRVSCIDALTSVLVTTPGPITIEDCPGEDRPPLGYEILLLLTQATPAEATA
ncbi:hypothetical protein [Micromonospora sp. WMMD712]|uniref:hypothetical protein n=1 Tax=Micromonospora sp. WMMD712 TaxID=3016096 RepID=UPI00249BABD1|nr:hypothetical protein [Micromonospora sp. WMMD712]WFE58273.1 hypothetical protein O7633_16040 [Micromonospora sp. WMMD712]